MWPGKLFGLGFKSCWQLSFGFETRSNLQYFSRKHMTSYDIIWPCPSYFNLGLVDNKPEVFDRFRTWQFEGLLKRLHHERVHLRFGWLKDTGMKVTGWFWMILDDFGWFLMISDDFGYLLRWFCQWAQASHMTPNSCAKNCNLTSKTRGDFSARKRQLWCVPMRVSKKESPNFKIPFLEVPCEFSGVFLYNMTLMVCMMNLQSTQYSNKMFDQVRTAILVAVAVIIHRNASEKGNQSSSQSWMRYCARLQLALLQNVEDNLVRQQAELDLVNHPVLFQ